MSQPEEKIQARKRFGDLFFLLKDMHRELYPSGKRFTLTKLAETMGIDTSTLNGIKNGEHKIQPYQWNAIRRILGKHSKFAEVEHKFAEKIKDYPVSTDITPQETQEQEQPYETPFTKAVAIMGEFHKEVIAILKNQSETIQLIAGGMNNLTEAQKRTAKAQQKQATTLEHFAEAQKFILEEIRAIKQANTK